MHPMRFSRVERNPSPSSLPPQRGGGMGSLAAPQGGGGSWCPPYNPYRGTDVVIPGCGKPVSPACDVQQVAFRQAAIAAQTATTFTVAPIRTNYFQALAARFTIVDGSNPDTNRSLELHTVTINAIPQDAFVNQNTATGNTSVVHSAVFTVPEGYGTPVAWGVFAQANLIHVLQLGVFTRYGAGTTVDAYISLFGNPLDSLPAGYTIGQPFWGE